MKAINASKLMLKELPDGNYLVTKEAIRNASTFETELITYCKDCEFYKYKLYCLIYCDTNDKSTASRRDYDFCSRAVPRGKYR